MKLWLTGNGYVENTKNMKKYRNVCTNVEIFGENTKTFGERGKKKMAAPMELPKTGNGYAEFPKVSSNFENIPSSAQIFGENVEMFGKNSKYLVKIRKNSPNFKKFRQNAEKFGKISKYLVKI